MYGTVCGWLEGPQRVAFPGNTRCAWVVNRNSSISACRGKSTCMDRSATCPCRHHDGAAARKVRVRSFPCYVHDARAGPRSTRPPSPGRRSSNGVDSIGTVSIVSGIAVCHKVAPLMHNGQTMINLLSRRRHPGNRARQLQPPGVEWNGGDMHRLWPIRFGKHRGKSEP